MYFIARIASLLVCLIFLFSTSFFVFVSFSRTDFKKLKCQNMRKSLKLPTQFRYNSYSHIPSYPNLIIVAARWRSWIYAPHRDGIWMDWLTCSTLSISASLFNLSGRSTQLLFFSFFQFLIRKNPKNRKNSNWDKFQNIFAKKMSQISKIQSF